MTRSGSKGISQPADRQAPLTSGCKLLERQEKGKVTRSTRHGSRIPGAGNRSPKLVDRNSFPVVT